MKPKWKCGCVHYSATFTLLFIQICSEQDIIFLASCSCFPHYLTIKKIYFKIIMTKITVCVVWVNSYYNNYIMYPSTWHEGFDVQIWSYWVILITHMTLLGVHKFKSQWCPSHPWPRAKRAKLAVFSRWEGRHTLHVGFICSCYVDGNWQDHAE